MWTVLQICSATNFLAAVGVQYLGSLNSEQIRCACSFKPKDDKLYHKPEWLPEYNNGKDFIPSFNIAPTDVTPVLVSNTKLKKTNKWARVLKPMMWGMIPQWHKGNYKGHNLSTNNCRIENIKNSKLYSPVLNNGGRCIIVVEGFYEWQTTKRSHNSKQAYYVYAPQHEEFKENQANPSIDDFSEEKGWNGIRLLYMAGLYDVWKNNDTVIYSYSVITMDSNDTLDWLHDRMPAILDTEEQIDAWLDVDNVKPDMALAYLKPVKLLLWHEVSSQVNNSRNKSSDCNKKISLENKNKTTQKTLTGWLSKVEKRKSTDSNSLESKKQKN